MNECHVHNICAKSESDDSFYGKTRQSNYFT